MMEHGVYIVDLEMKAVPRSAKSRIHPMSVKSNKHPVTLNSDGSIAEDSKKRISRSLMKKKAVNYDDYIVTIKYSNPKFSTKKYEPRTIN